MSDIIGQPGYEFYNLLPYERQEAAQELFDASLIEDPSYTVKLVNPKDEKFYYIVSERTEGGDFVEKSRTPSEWAAAVAVAGAWGQHSRNSERPTIQDIESMGVHFELIALRHLIAQQVPEETTAQRFWREAGELTEEGAR